MIFKEIVPIFCHVLKLNNLIFFNNDFIAKSGSN